jgi:deoxycytidylate deaminase
MELLTGQPEQEAIKWMNEAAKVATRALCLNAKCGAVIVKDGEIIGAGYNAPPLDQAENRMCVLTSDPAALARRGKPKYDFTCCLHAEWRAILDALKRNANKIEGAKLYFVRVDETGHIKKSGQPYCTACSRLALDVGLDKFLLWHEKGIGEYPTDEYNRLSYEYRP